MELTSAPEQCLIQGSNHQGQEQGRASCPRIMATSLGMAKCLVGLYVSTWVLAWAKTHHPGCAGSSYLEVAEAKSGASKQRDVSAVMGRKVKLRRSDFHPNL